MLFSLHHSLSPHCMNDVINNMSRYHTYTYTQTLALSSMTHLLSHQTPRLHGKQKCQGISCVVAGKTFLYTLTIIVDVNSLHGMCVTSQWMYIAYQLYQIMAKMLGFQKTIYKRKSTEKLDLKRYVDSYQCTGFGFVEPGT